MKSFEQLVKEYYEPPPEEDMNSLLFEMVEDIVKEVEIFPRPGTPPISMGSPISPRELPPEEEPEPEPPEPEEPEKSNVEKAIEAIEAEGYYWEFMPKSKTMIRVRAENRFEALHKLGNDKTGALSLQGFEHKESGQHTLGRLVHLGINGGGRAYVYFKDVYGKKAADVGAEAEKRIADRIKDLYGGMGFSSDCAGSGAGSDVCIVGPPPRKDTLTIEVKTNISSDFGQFRLRYNIEKRQWGPSSSGNYLKHRSLFESLWKKYLEPTMSEFGLEPPGLGSEEFNERYSVVPIYKKEGKKRMPTGESVVIGLRATPRTAEFRHELEKRWFGRRTDHWVEIEEFDEIVDYYKNKGDRFIQIGVTSGAKGLYALNDVDARRFDIPRFDGSGKRAWLRLRLKPSGGRNSKTSFGVAIKIRGELKKSPLNLMKDEDLERVISTMGSEV